MYIQNEDFYASEKIEDGTICECTEEYCREKATHFTPVKRGLLTFLLPVCEKHDKEVYHAINVLPKLNQEHPEAPCLLIRNGRAYHWLVLQCPYCGHSHWHDAGKGEIDPREYLGLQEPDCEYPFREVAAKGGNYNLVDVSPYGWHALLAEINTA